MWKYNFFLKISLVIILINGCKPKESGGFGRDISKDPEIIDNGRVIFEELCSSCHNFKQDAIGPNLSGLTRALPTNWIKEFIKSPIGMIDLKDKRAVALKEKYKAVMPNFQHLSEADIEAVIAYINTYGKTHPKKETDLIAIEDPIPEKISFSGETAKLEYIGQIPASSTTQPYTRINKLACEKNFGRIFVNDLRGTLYELRQRKANIYLDLNKTHPNFIDRNGMATGFGSFAFHPEFNKNGLFYTSHTEVAGSKQADFKLPDSVKVVMQGVVTEWKAKDPGSLSFSGQTRELVRFDFIAISHGLQEISFNPNANKGDMDYGKLYISLGDGGAVQVGYPKIADHHGTDVWGSILRIDPMGDNSTNNKYGIPKDNPFADSISKRKEIWAYGFRNPNRITWIDSNRILASDIGQANIEELNIVEPGNFYGWPIREGKFLFNPNGNFNSVYTLPDNDHEGLFTYPVVQYDHDEGPAISGGFIAKGKLYRGKYIFGDIPTGRIFISDLEGTDHPKIEELKIVIDNKETNFYELTKSSRVDLKFGRGCGGDIYIFTKADGKIYRLQEL
tara:strand:- start:2331 stop:4019 length:1689 start_codon:yes stop_codon:yes gene_type:complete